jgi:drug/metabolite transporter (DMT)-like permease
VETAKPIRAAFVALVAGAVCIGFAPVLVRLSEVGPSATAFFRLLFALPFLWLWMSVDRVAATALDGPSTRHDFLLLGLAGLFFTCDLALWHWSLQFTTVANSTLLSNLAPLFVTWGARLFLGEKITPAFMAGMVVALVGAALLVSGRIDFRPHQLLGDGLAVLTAAFYAAYLLSVKQLRKRLRTPQIMAWSGIVSCLSLLSVALLSNETLMPASVQGWCVVVALGLISHLGGQTAIAYALGHLPASFSSVTLLLQPLLAALLAWLLLKESLNLWQWMGGIIILIGIFLAGRRRPADTGHNGTQTETNLKTN